MDALVMSIMLQDLKQALNQIASIIQITVSKYAQILQSAAVAKTSPYALHTAEVQMLSQALYINKGLHLQTDLNQIRSTALIDNNKLTLIFSIPVLSEAHQFNFYSPTPIPIFNNTEVYMPQLDAPYIAISKSGAKYYTMTAEEFRQCKTQPNECTIHRPAKPLNDKSSCTITSYTTNSLQCPVVAVKDPHLVPPFFHIDGNRVIYATNGSLTMYIKCQEHRHTSQYKDESLIITDRGEVNLRPSCFVTLPDGSTFETSNVQQTLELKDLPIYTPLLTLPKPTGYKISKTNDSIFHFNTTILIEKDVKKESELSLEEMIENAFKPSTSIAVATWLSISIFFILATAITCCCCRHNIMDCLRKTNLRKPNPNKPSRVINKYQIEVREHLDQIGKDLHSFKDEIKNKLTTQENRKNHDNQIHLDGTLTPNLQNVRFQVKPDYAEFNPPSFNRSKIREFHSKDFPQILKTQLAQADLAYRKEPISKEADV